MESTMNQLAEKATQGDRDSLEGLIEGIQHRVYGLSLRMLYHPQDAEDATQEILIRIITHLSSFAHKSSFETWALKVASNHLLGVRRKKALSYCTFSQCESMIEANFPDEASLAYDAAEQDLIVEELRLCCMQALLQCLDWEHRIAYILGQTMDVKSPEGAAILGINPAAFRQRLSRAREKIRGFMIKNCDIMEDGNPCNCLRQGTLALHNGAMTMDNLPFAKHPVRSGRNKDVHKGLKAIDKLTRETAIMRSHPDYAAPEGIVVAIRQMLDAGKFKDLQDHQH